MVTGGRGVVVEFSGESEVDPELVRSFRMCSTEGRAAARSAGVRSVSVAVGSVTSMDEESEDSKVAAT